MKIIVFASLLLMISSCVDKSQNNKQIPSNNISDKRHAVTEYINKTYKLDNDTIYTDLDGENFTLNLNKYYLISILDLIVGASGNLEKIKSGKFDFYIDGNIVSVSMSKDISSITLDNNELHYLLFQITNIDKKEDKYLDLYNIEAKGIDFISENYFYEKAKY
ncbi:hypothetical protein [Dysgonomonas sp. 216]|uniref:hypothetical protein n=1 Tax=Dysgonomonas sp. 216 TaxID=2302934 RepID=UPI0013D19EE2|nr:hypothetical protein [Dysgonomonas sp. 216]